MGLLGSIAGGALQGLGTGIVNDAITRRNEALENMKIQAEAARQRAGFQQQEKLADIQHTNKLGEIDAEGENRVAALKVGGEVTAQTNKQQHIYKVDEIKHEQVGRQELARLESTLQMGRTAAEARLRDQLESGDISSVVKGDDGTYYGVTDKGLVKTGVKAAISAAEANSNGGGVLTDADKTSALSDAEDEWRDGGRKGAKPKASDFIGMTQEQYRQKYGAAPGAAKAAPAAPAGKGIDPADRERLYSQALTKAQGGDPKWKGMTAQQIKAKVDDLLRNNGY